jgi:hypothetical protein
MCVNWLPGLSSFVYFPFFVIALLVLFCFLCFLFVSRSGVGGGVFFCHTALHTEGIFRVSGSYAEVDKLKILYLSGRCSCSLVRCSHAFVYLVLDLSSLSLSLSLSLLFDSSLFVVVFFVFLWSLITYTRMSSHTYTLPLLLRFSFLCMSHRHLARMGAFIHYISRSHTHSLFLSLFLCLSLSLSVSLSFAVQIQPDPR